MMENENLQTPVQPGQPENLVQPVEEEKKSRLSKFALIGFAVLAILLIAGGTYFLGSKRNKQSPAPTPVAQKPTPTPDPKKNWIISESQTTLEWNTFKNIAMNYSFDADKQWAHDFESDANESCAYFIIKIPERVDESGPSHDITMSVCTKPTNLTKIDKSTYRMRKPGEPFAANNSTTAVSDTTVDGITAVQSEGSYEGEGVRTDFIKDGYLYSIGIGSNYKIGPYISQYDKLLSTFKFTNLTSSNTDTSDWKTYSNLRFSIKYPSNWIIDKFTTEKLNSNKEVDFKSNDYKDDGGMPMITKGFKVNTSYKNGCVKDALSGPQPETARYYKQNEALLPKGFIVERGWEGLSYTIVPDSSVDFCLFLFPAATTDNTSATPFSNSVFVQNKNDLINAALSFTSL